MAISSTTTFTVGATTPLSAAADAVVQPAVGYGTGGRGRLVHPTLGSFDYVTAPTEVVNLDGDVLFSPVWAHARTLGGGVDALWSGYMRDPVVVERWQEGEVGCAIGHLRQLWQLFTNPPDPVSGTPVVWSPSYVNDRSYKVLLVALAAGGEQVTLDLRLARWGYAKAPVELSLRVLDYAD